MSDSSPEINWVNECVGYVTARVLSLELPTDATAIAILCEFIYYQGLTIELKHYFEGLANAGRREQVIDHTSAHGDAQPL